MADFDTHAKHSSSAHAQAPTRNFPSGPVVLTAKSCLLAHADLVQALREALYTFETVPNWERLPAQIETSHADLVLVDMDAVERVHKSGRLDVSGYRLVTLLGRQLETKPTALVVLTHLDFAEIEDLARQGVSALLSPSAPPEVSRAQIEAALRRKQRRYDRSDSHVGREARLLPSGNDPAALIAPDTQHISPSI